MWRTTRAETPAELAAALEIRDEVFVREQRIPPEVDRDGLDPEALHLLLLDGETPVATGRVLVRPPEAVAGRIAVRAGWRGRGLGRRVVRALEELARAEGARTVVLHPHDYLERFYRGLGYRRTAGEQHAGEHRLLVMRKRL